MKEKTYQIQLKSRVVVILTADEIHALLQKDTEIYKRGLKRGKGMLRARKQRKREKEKFERENRN